MVNGGITSSVVNILTILLCSMSDLFKFSLKIFKETEVVRVGSKTLSKFVAFCTGAK